MENEALKKRVLEHEIVERLLNNPNWKPAALAAVGELLDGKKCPVPSWRRSTTCAQVKMVYD